MKDEDMIAECMEFMGDDRFTDWEEEFLHKVSAQKDDGLKSLSDKQQEKLEEIYDNMSRERRVWEDDAR